MNDWLNRCHFGDCRELMPRMPEGIADACIADPPYGDTVLEWDKRCDGWISAAAHVLKPAASIWVFGSMRFLPSVFAEMEQAGFRYAQDIVWEKQNGTGFHNDRFRRVHEHAVQFYRGAWADVFKDPQFTMDARAKTVRKQSKPPHWHGAVGSCVYTSETGGPRLQRSVQYMANEHGHALHATQKPLGILAPLISYSVPARGVVLDPFFGSGSLGVAAELLGRKYIGCEIDPACLEMQNQRARQRGLQLEPA